MLVCHRRARRTDWNTEEHQNLCQLCEVSTVNAAVTGQQDPVPCSRSALPTSPAAYTCHSLRGSLVLVLEASLLASHRQPTPYE